MQAANSVTPQKFALYCNLVFVFLTAVGWLGIAHFWAPAPADLSLDETKQWFSETYRWQTIFGCTLFYIGAGFLTPGSIQFAFMLSKIEGRVPVWSVTTGVCGIFISLIIFFNCCAWIVCAYRGETSADVIQSWYDWSWFAFLLGWIYLIIEMISTAVVELMDKREVPMIPRWFTWFTLASGVTLVTAAGPAFFKSGPFAYHGLLAFYMPVVIWGVYIFGTTLFMIKELGRDRTTTGAASPVSGAAAAARA